MEISFDNVDLMHPNYCPDKVLIWILKQRCVKNINFDNISRGTLLRLFQNYILPLPQRFSDNFTTSEDNSINDDNEASQRSNYFTLNHTVKTNVDVDSSSFQLKKLQNEKMKKEHSVTNKKLMDYSTSSQKIILKRKDHADKEPIFISKKEKMSPLNKIVGRIPYETLSGLAGSLLDGTVFEIVSGLEEIQQVTEKHLFQQRQQLLIQQKAEREKLQQQYRLALSAQENHEEELLELALKHRSQMTQLEERFKEELSRFDMHLILQIDQKVSDQQVTLEKAGVPGFFVTNNPTDIRVQMYLLNFITRLGQFVNTEKS